MSDVLEPLIRDLVVWCAREPRTYDEVLDAWRTSCPRLTVWEEAVARGLVETRPGNEGNLHVHVTSSGHILVGDTSLAPTVHAPAAALVPV